ncbi:MAG: D-xylose transport system permease protein [Actinomycetota bacterium]|jgi:D-xylose transport system permease protein|nr:transporter permease [Glaciihabitans sp.]MDQ1544605.1 D-xylose transport system permease protein [Actinomycetota bacterium]MDQ1560781.1 D-xylose transport system permease protein [Actinomycetota bacterium]MDQ1572626.1 D-xylose transport system permease protein [Actinomycetota bacterium]
MSVTTTSETPAPETGVTDLIGSGQDGNLRDQAVAYIQRVRNGEMGALPALSGFIVLCVLFTALSPFFLTERNFANLLTQAATLVMLAMALVFVILLGEIDLSAGVTSGVAMSMFVVLSDPGGIAMNWILALIISLLAGVAIGMFIGFFVARVGIPSFVVTLGLFLGFQGLQLIIIGAGGLYRIQQDQILAIQNNNLPDWGGWVMLAVVILVSFSTSMLDRRRRTRAGVSNRTITLLVIRLALIAVIGGVVIALLNQNRGTGFLAVSGVPIVVPITLFILWVGTFVLDRTKFGRAIYAVGGNAEAARRAGIKVVGIKWAAFAVCSTLAVVSGVFSASKVGSVDAAFGRDIVLSGVAAAVVGGVSLFGGRGRLIHAAIGALVIAVITNGLGLLNLPGGVNFLVTGGVLILAATVDAVSRVRAGGSIMRR